jgi:hypothetical protein
MPEAVTTFDVRELSQGTRAIDIKGDITAQSEDILMDAYGRASGPLPARRQTAHALQQSA